MLIAGYQVGRLVETHGEGIITFEEFSAFRSVFQQKMALVGGKVIAFGDLRAMAELQPDVAPMVLGMLRADNARIDRAAHLVTAGSAFATQYERLIGATRNAMRQMFTDPEAMLLWLRPALTDAELARLRSLVSSPTA